MNIKCNDQTRCDIPEELNHGWGYRHLQTVLMCCCVIFTLSIRFCMGVALVAMCPMNNVTLENNNISNVSSVSDRIPTFDWDKKSQDMIQSSFYWGYMVMQLPGGALAHRLGGKFLIVAALAINGGFSICLPSATIYGGFWWLMVFRASQGLSQAVLLPSLHTLLGKWAPLPERARMTTFVYGGIALGAAVGISVSGVIASSSLGWPGIFWVNGSVALAMAAVTACAIAETPAQHTKISAQEKLYIHLGIHQKHGNSENNLPVPWKDILTSKGMWAIVASHIGDSWGTTMLFTQIPAYMSNIMKVDIKSNGALTALPYILTWCTSHFYSWMADLIINKKLLSVTNTRKLANTIGCWPAAVAVASMPFVPSDNLLLFEIVLVTASMLEVSLRTGYQVNHIDIAPNFSGTMISISNFISNGISSFAPMLAAHLVTDVKQQHQWRLVFIAAAGVYFLANVVFILFGTAEKAAWNDPRSPDAEPCDPDDNAQKNTQST